MRHFATRLVGGLMLLVALAAVVGVPGALSAKEPQTLTITAVRTSESGEAAAQATITCNHSIGNPHKSTHNPQNVNVVSRIQCSAPVPSLSINPIRLYRNFFQVASGSNSRVWQASVQANAATLCIPANYDGRSWGYISFPPGYQPSAWSGTVSSSLVYVSCL